MDHLMSRYFEDAHFSDENRPLFAFAACNAGPGRMARMRREAAEARRKAREQVGASNSAGP